MNIRKRGFLVVMLFTLFFVAIDSAAAMPPKPDPGAASAAGESGGADGGKATITPERRSELTEQLLRVLDKKEMAIPSFDESDIYAIENLIRAGANPNVCARYGITPLKIVIERGRHPK